MSTERNKYGISSELLARLGIPMEFGEVFPALCLVYKLRTEAVWVGVPDDFKKDEDDYTQFLDIDVTTADGEGNPVNLGKISARFFSIYDYVAVGGDPFDLFDTNADTCVCYELMEDAVSVGEMESALYLDGIHLKEEYAGLGLEEFLLDHMEKIISKLYGAMPDGVFMLATPKEQEWVNRSKCKKVQRLEPASRRGDPNLALYMPCF